MKLFRNLLVVVLIIIILILLFFNYFNLPQTCSETNFINSSITVQGGERRFVGMNTDTDSLRFGKVSSEAVVKRIVKVEYDSVADVSINMFGDFSSWMTIKPRHFQILPNEQKEVSFEVTVPPNTPDSELIGVAEFCFKDK